MGRLLRAAPLPPWLRPLLLLLAGGECAPAAGGRAGGGGAGRAGGRAAGRGAGQLPPANKGPARGGSAVWRGCGAVLPPHALAGSGGRGATACACGACGPTRERHTHTYTHQRVSPRGAGARARSRRRWTGGARGGPRGGEEDERPAGLCDSLTGMGDSIRRSPGAATASVGWECLRRRGEAANAPLQTAAATVGVFTRVWGYWAGGGVCRGECGSQAVLGKLLCHELTEEVRQPQVSVCDSDSAG